MKTNMTRILIAFAGVIGAALICTAAWFLYTRYAPRHFKEDLSGFSYSSGGGMSGGYDAIEIKPYDEEHVLIINTSKEWYNAPTTASETLADKAVLKDLQKVFYKYNMGRWEYRGRSRIVILDGETSTYSFAFGDQETSFSSTQSLPLNSYEATASLHEIINTYVHTGTVLPGYTLEISLDDDGYMLNTPEGKITMLVGSYYDRTLELIFSNRTEEDYEFLPEGFLYKEGESEPLCELKDSWNQTLNSNNMTQLEFSLKERLEPGRYHIEMGDFTTDFEIQ